MSAAPRAERTIVTLSITPDETRASTGSELPTLSGRFDVRTTRADATRANLQVSGRLDAGSAALLQHVIDGHVRAGRRYLRLHVGGVESISADALAVVAATHERLLALRGTLILTGVHDRIEPVLRAAAPASPLLLLAVTAADTS